MTATKIPMALQMYSIRKVAEQDLAGTLRAVADMGYDGVEFAGYYGHEAADIRRMLDDVGLRCAGAHLGVKQLQGDELVLTAEFNRTLGNDRLIIAHLPEEMRNTREACLRSAEMLTDMSGRAAAVGARVGYHNHFTEFTPLAGGELAAWDLLFQNTPDAVIMQLDTGNAMHGGADPLVYLRRYPGRAKSVHLKEYSGGYDKALVGEGDTPWAEVFELCETIGSTEWYVVEQENYALDPLECVKRCRENLAKMGR